MRAARNILTPLRLRAIFVGLGTILTGLTAVEIYLWWVLRSVIEISFVAGILLSLPASVLLIAGGYWLPQTTVSEDAYGRLLVWTLAGMVVFGGFSAITGITFFPELTWAQIGSVRWGTAVGGGSGFLVGFLIARGIERRVAAERAAIRAEEANEKQEILEYLNALLRHEVLNTAQVISGQAHLLESELADDVSAQQYTNVIQRQAEELSSVTRDVRFLLEASRDDSEPEPIQLSSVLETELRNVEDRHNGVKTDLDAPSGVHVLADDLVRRVFSNLFSNAAEHNDSEPKRVSVSVTPDTETVTVEVTDNGPGIPDDDIEGLFDPVPTQRADHGLGLTIVARLVERYDGTIELVDTGPHGSTFAVTLPRRDADAGSTSDAPQREDGDLPAQTP